MLGPNFGMIMLKLLFPPTFAILWILRSMFICVFV